MYQLSTNYDNIRKIMDFTNACVPDMVDLYQSTYKKINDITDAVNTVIRIMRDTQDIDESVKLSFFNNLINQISFMYSRTVYKGIILLEAEGKGDRFYLNKSVIYRTIHGMYEFIVILKTYLSNIIDELKTERFESIRDQIDVVELSQHLQTVDQFIPNMLNVANEAVSCKDFTMYKSCCENGGVFINNNGGSLVVDNNSFIYTTDLTSYYDDRKRLTDLNTKTLSFFDSCGNPWYRSRLTRSYLTFIDSSERASSVDDTNVGETISLSLQHIENNSNKRCMFEINIFSLMVLINKIVNKSILVSSNKTSCIDDGDVSIPSEIKSAVVERVYNTLSQCLIGSYARLAKSDNGDILNKIGDAVNRHVNDYMDTTDIFNVVVSAIGPRSATTIDTDLMPGIANIISKSISYGVGLKDLNYIESPRAKELYDKIFTVVNILYRCLTEVESSDIDHEDFISCVKMVRTTPLEMELKTIISGHSLSDSVDNCRTENVRKSYTRCREIIISTAVRTLTILSVRNYILIASDTSLKVGKMIGSIERNEVIMLDSDIRAMCGTLLYLYGFFIGTNNIQLECSKSCVIDLSNRKDNGFIDNISVPVNIFFRDLVYKTSENEDLTAVLSEYIKTFIPHVYSVFKTDVSYFNDSVSGLKFYLSQPEDPNCNVVRYIVENSQYDSIISFLFRDRSISLRKPTAYTTTQQIIIDKKEIPFKSNFTTI